MKLVSLTLTFDPRDDVDVRVSHVFDVPHFPPALVYVSTQIDDPRVEAFVDYAVGLGLPRTSTYPEGDGVGYDMLEAGPGWRLELSPARRLVVRARGVAVAEVARTSAPAGALAGALAERRALVVVGGPAPLMYGEGDVRETLTWMCTHPTASGVVPVVEIP